MATRVDPKQYSDTPIFQALLEARDGRWPGIPEGDVYDPLEHAVSTLEAMALRRPPVMLKVIPIPPEPDEDEAVEPDPEPEPEPDPDEEDTREIAFDPEETAPIPALPAPES